MGWLVERLAIGPGRTVVDLAAGTGKLTRLLVPTGARVVAVEPVEEMLAQLRRAVPAAEALAGTAEHMPLPDASADAVTVAQAFHWFDVQATLAELARVLKPGGGLGLIWNTRDLRDELQKEVDELLKPAEAPVRWQWSIDIETAFEESPDFAALEIREFPFQQWLDADGLVERVASTSFVAMLADGERSELLARVREVGERREAPFCFPYTTQVFVSDRRAP